MAVAQPAGTVTLVFTDIDGSTRLLERLGAEAYRDALAAHRAVIRQAFGRGYEVDYEGDAFFYAFATAQDAVDAVSRAMAGLARGPIRIRVGVHTGTPVLDPPKYVGLDVHRAARVMSAAHGGQVILSPTTVALLEPDPARVRDLGRHRLKDLSSPIPLHQLLVEGLEQDFPPLRTLYRSNLPVPATPFLGRERELADVVSRIADTGVRLLTLTGPGGTGKTRLALQAAAESADRFPDGVTWVALAPLRDPTLVLPSVVRALELSEQPGVSAVDAVASALVGKQALLLLDNAEHLLPLVAEELATLTLACPTLKVVVTSRERLHVAVETSWPVPGLEPADAHTLFLERARAATPDVPDSAAVDAICARLDNLPLAIELAASRVRALAPETILTRLDARLAFLSSRMRDIDERHRTLRATIEWSYELLDEEERRVLRALSVFAGGCTLRAAEAVTRTDFAVLEALLDKSLLRHRADAGGDRYWLLETIREFAAEQLLEAGEHRDLRQAHADWFCAFASPPDGNFKAASKERRDELERDLDNLRIAHAFELEQGATLPALRLAADLFPLWELNDRVFEGERWFRRSLALTGGELSVDRAHCLMGLATLTYHQGAWDEVEEQIGHAIEILRANGADQELVAALSMASWVPARRDEALARAYLEEALKLGRRVGTPYDLRSCLHALGELERNVGSYDRGAEYLEEALHMAEQAGDPEFVGAIGHSLADLELYRGHTGVARRRYLEAASACIDGGYPSQVALCVGGLAAAFAREGDVATAALMWGALRTWESERGLSLLSWERAQYEQAIESTVVATAPFTPLGMEEAIRVAAAVRPDLAPPG